MKLFNIVIHSFLMLLLTSAISVAAFTAGQDVSVREGDQWSDATIQKVEGRKFQVKYPDGTEEWVTADRLKAKSDSPGTPTPQPSAKPEIKSAITLEGPFTPIELKPAKGIEKRATGQIVVKPTTRPTSNFTDLSPGSGLPFRSVDQLILCADTPNVVVAVGEKKDDDIPLFCIDLNQPAGNELRVITAPRHRVIAVGNAGKTAVSRPDDWGTQTLSLWNYINGEFQLKANYSFVQEGKNVKPEEVIVLTPNRIVVRVGFNDNYLVDLPTRKQIGYLKCGDIKLHCSGQYLLAPRDQAKIIIRPSDLAIMLELQNHDSIFSLDPTGAFVANGDQRSLMISKIATKSQVSTIAGIPPSQRIDLLTQDKLLVDGKYYYDLKTGIPVWKYEFGQGKSLLLPNGQMLYVSSINGQMSVSMVSVPDDASAKALSRSKPDQFDIAPGAHIAITGDLGSIGSEAEVKKSLEQTIKTAGHVLDASATMFKLNLTTAAGPTGKFSIREWSMTGPPAIREVDAPSTIVTATLTKAEKTIWTREIKFSAQVMVTRKEGQSLEDAVAEAGRPNAHRLGYLDLPSYIVKDAKPGEISTLGSSELTASGFVESKVSM